MKHDLKKFEAFLNWLQNIRSEHYHSVSNNNDRYINLMKQF